MKTYTFINRIQFIACVLTAAFMLPVATNADTVTITSDTNRNLGSTGDQLPSGAGVQTEYIINDGVTLTFSTTFTGADRGVPGMLWNTSATGDSLTIGPSSPNGTGSFYIYGGGNVDNPSLPSGATQNGALLRLAGGRHTVSITSGTIKSLWATSSGGVIWSNTGHTTVTLKNVTLENNGARMLNQKAFGGAIFMNNSGTQVLVLQDVIFRGNNIYQYNSTQNNSLEAKGGAIYFGNGLGSLTMNNVSFYNNTASGKAISAASATGYGGALYLNTNAKMVMTGGTFSGNYAGAYTASDLLTGNGGAVYQEGVSTYARYTDVTFIDNSAPNNGGAMTLSSNGGTLGLTNVLFERNKGRTGGALYMQSNDWGTYDNVTFRSNSAVANGGALYFVDNANPTGAYSTFNNVTFADNIVSNTIAAAVSISGGAIHMTTNAKALMSNVLFSGNVARASSLGQSATARGGAIYESGTGTLLTINSGTFENNRVTGSVVSGVLTAQGGAIYQDKTAYVLTDVLFNQNTADTAGGALFVTVTPVSGTGTFTFTVSDTLNNAVFTNNRAGQGGALAMEITSSTQTARADFTVNGGVFAGNSAAKIGVAAASGAGGAAYIRINNTDSGTGATTANVTFNDVLFSDNTASGTLGMGGAIAISGSGAVANIAITAAGQDMAYTGNAAYGNGEATPIASLGGFVFATLDATVNFDVAAGKTLSIGSADNTSVDTVVGDATSAINVNAGNPANTGALVLHGNSSANRARIQVAGGSLLLGNTGARLGGPVTVGAGGAFGGMGTATGDVLVGPGGILNVGLTHNDAGVTARQHLIITGALTLDDAMLRFDLYTGQQSDLLTAGSIIQSGTSHLDVNIFRSGTYRLIDVLGADGLSLFDLDLLAPATFGGLPLAEGNTETYRIIDNSLWLILGLTNHVLTWTGSTSFNWTPGLGNWSGVGSSQFSFGDKVIFDDTVPVNAARAIEVTSAGVQASDLIVSGTGNYSFTGGMIVTSTVDSTLAATASAKLVKDGSGTLDLSGQNAGVTNDFQGGIDLNAGTLRIATAGQLGTTLSRVNFLGAPTAATTLAIAPYGVVTLDAAGTASQRITLAAGKAAVVDLGADSMLTIRNNNSGGTNGGAANVAATGALTLAAAPDAAYHFDNNVTSAKGGAIYNAGQLTLANAHFASNSAAQGGAIHNDAGALRLEVTAGGGGAFVGNTASDAANSIHNDATAGNATLALSIGAGGVLDMRDPMTGAAANGNAIAITSTGAGLWKLGGANTFTADASAASKTTLAVTTGTLHLYHDASITLGGAASAITLGAPAGRAALELGGDGAISASRIDILNTAVSFTAPTPGATLSLDGAVTLENAGLNIRANTGDVADRIAVTGTVALSGANTLNITRWNNGTFAILASTSTLAAGAGTTFAPATYDGNSLSARQTASIFLDATGKQLMLALGSTNAALAWTGNSDIWDTSAGSNWSSGDSRFIANDSVRFGDTAAGGSARTVTIAAAGVQAADIVVETAGSYTFNGSGAIETDAAGTTIAAAAGALAKLGSGTLTLANTAPNTFAGGIHVDEGTLIGNAAALGTGLAGIAIDSDGTLVFDQASDASYAGDINGAGNLVKTNAGNLTLAGATTHAGATQLTAGALTLANVDQIASSGTVTLAAATTLHTGTNSQHLNALNGSGNIVATAATLTLNAAAATLNNNAVATLTLDNTTTSTLTLNNAVADTLYTGIIAGAAAVTKDGAATLTLTGNNTHTGITTIAGGTLQLGNGGAGGSVAGAIANNAALALHHGANDITLSNVITGAGLITKLAADTGALTLTADSAAFTGTTSILVGSLILADNARLGGLIELGAGADFAGDGSATGDLAAQGGNTITVGLTHGSHTVTLPQTLVIGGTLTLANATTLRYDIYENSAGDLITAAALVRTGTGTIDVNTAMSGTYKLITTAAAFALTSTDDLLTTINGEALSVRSTAGYFTDGNSLWLDLHSENYSQVAWNGSNTGEWTENIRDWDSPDQKFLNGDSVLFDDTAATRDVTVALAGVRASDMIVNAAGNYTFTGGAITTSTANSTLSGSSTVHGRLEKLGAGTLILNNGANNFTGGILISAGTLQGDASTLGAGVPGITNNATLIFDQAGDGTYVGAITGDGLLIKQNTGALALTNPASSHTGGIRVAAGELALLTGGTATHGALDITTGATLRIGNGAAYDVRHALTGSGTLAFALDTVAARITFAAASGTDFNGTMQFGQGTLMLDNAAATALRAATLALGVNNTAIVGPTGGAAGEQQIGNLALNGATLVFTATIPADPAANGVLQTTDLALNSGTVRVAIPFAGLANPLPAGSASFFVQDDGAVVTHLIEASGAITGNVTALELVDQDGLAVGAGTARAVAITEGGATVATGTYNYTLDSTGGLNVIYGLTALDLAGGNTLHLAPGTGANGGAADLKAAITGTGNLSIAASSAADGIVTLSNIANTFTGTTLVTGGTLRLGAANALGTGGLNGLVLADGAALHLNANAQALGTILTATDSAINVAGGALTIAGGGHIAGALTGAGTLEITGGTLRVVSGNAGLTANTSINNGATVDLADASALGTGNITLNGATASLVLSADTSGTLRNLLTGAGALNMTGTGTVALAGNNGSFRGPVIVTAGRLVVIHGDALGAGPVDIGANGNIDIATDTALANAISGSGAINFTSGASTLSGTNTIARINVRDGASLTATGTYSLGAAVSKIGIHDGSLTVASNGVSLGDITMSGTGRLGFGATSGFRKVTAASLVSTGAEATLVFNTDLSASGTNARSDTLIVTGAVTGTYKLALNNVNLTPPTLFDVTLNLVQNSGTAATYISERDIMTIGSSLTLYSVAILPGSGASMLVHNTNNLSELGAAIISTVGATPLTWLAELDSVEQRMGDIRLNPRKEGKDFWLRGYARRLDVKKHAAGAAFAENQYGADAGYDIGGLRHNDCAAYYGLFAGYGAATRDIAGQVGNGHGDSVYGGVYATFVTPGGWYADMIGKYNHFANSFETRGDGLVVTGRIVNDAFGASLEGGKLIRLGERWYVQPDVQFAAAKYSNGNFTSSNNMTVTIGGGNTLQLRGGVQLGYKHVAPSGKIMQPYARIRAAQLWSTGNEVAAGFQRRKTAIDGGRLDTGVGVNFASPNGIQVYFDFETSAGDDYNKPYNIIAGIHYAW